MSTSVSMPTMDEHYLQCKAEAEHQLDSGMELEAVEKTIDADVMLSAEQRDDLKLWAWAWKQSQPRPLKRRLRRKVALVPMHD